MDGRKGLDVASRKPRLAKAACFVEAMSATLDFSDFLTSDLVLF